MDIKKVLKDVPKEYRPIPFWSWNEKLDVEETRKQVRLMHKAGLGGAFMHARGGLQTEYMGDEWFQNVDASIDECQKYGMQAWAYDENGWPSGFGAGAVNELGIDYQQKYLRIEIGEKNEPQTIANVNGYHLYYEVNPFYVDNLDKKVVQKFIEAAYKPYAEKYKGKMPGIFTDEPQVSRNGIPWSFVLPEEYEKAYSDDLILHLPELFFETGDYKQTRFRFWKLVCNLFTNAYVKQIYEYLDKNGMRLTGHMVLEDNLLIQITSNGAVMPQYEYFHIPGIDWLSRSQINPLIPLQLSSVAHQTGKKQILTESFALCGHNVSFEELRWLLESQFVRGVNLLCPHLEGYSLRGIRKRDYPPAMYCQQPWWDEYSIFTEQMSRIGILLTEGKVKFDTLVIHPQSAAWTMFDNAENKGIRDLNAKFMKIIDKLERKHILFHLGDETIMEKHAEVKNGEIVIGSQHYKNVILVQDEVLFDSTKNLLSEFKSQGGVLTNADEIARNKVCDNEKLTYTCRHFDGFTMHYFVNETTENQTANIFCGGKMMDLNTGDFVPFSGSHLFAPMSSLVVIDDGTACIAKDEQEESALKLPENWQLVRADKNALALDKCDYWFDGELIEKNAYVLDIADKANALERKVNIRMRYTFKADFVPNEIYLACETPKQYEIKVNGAVLSEKPCGFFRDRAFELINIAPLVREGENEIVLTCDFKQSDECLQMIKNSRIFESEKNKLAYDMEIEGIFIVGDFDVLTEKEKFAPLKRNAERYSGDFVISKKTESLKLKHIEMQGYPFFSGKLTVKSAFSLAENSGKTVLKFNKKGINAIEVRINGYDAGTLIWNPFEMDITPFVHAGENEMELSIVNNLRNLLGPHHLEEGESYSVGPGSFYKSDSPFAWGIDWNDDYCFVETSVE